MPRWLRGRLLPALAVVVGLGLFGYLLSLAPGDRLEPASDEPGVATSLEVAPRIGALAPNFTLTDLEGEAISLADLRGRPLLVAFWATWCEPCKVEMPFIEERYVRYRERGLRVLAVDFDEPAEAVAAFRDEMGLTFEILLDPGGRVQQLYQVRGYPSSYYIDAAGVIRAQQIGVMTEGQLDEHLATLGLEP